MFHKYSCQFFSFLNLHSPITALLSISDKATISMSADCARIEPFLSVIFSTSHQVPTEVTKQPYAPVIP